MEVLNENDKTICRELIKNPRLSDNKISKFTGIPVKTVNRKRKKLEQNNILNYLIHIENGPDGTNKFGSKAQFIVTFRQGITRKIFYENLMRVGFSYHEIKHVRDANIGEYEGRLTFILVIESRVQSDLLEVFNSDIVPKLQNMLGHNSIYETRVIYLHSNVITMHNYIKDFNITNGKITNDWPNEKIYVWE
ncbi:MAG: winged helix-turn-helix domain-containing protein [Nanoarchaeota archaeon]